MADAPNTIDRVETAANITVQITYVGILNDIEQRQTIEIPVSEIDVTKEVDISRVREMGMYPDGYAINSIDIDGSISFAGNVVRLPGSSKTKNLDDILFKDDGTPKIFDISIIHNVPDSGEEASTDTIENAIMNSSQYNASAGDSTESSYEFMGQRFNPSD